MGCDIHLFAEIKRPKKLFQFWKKKKWESIDTWELDNDYDIPRINVPYKKRFYTGGRNYNLFSALCGVRSRHFNDNPPRISNPKGVPKDSCSQIKAQVDYWDGDGHSHSYNTLSELKSFDWSEYGATCNNFISEVIPKMESYGVSGDNIRIVYFFDN